MKLYESLFILRKSAEGVKATWNLVNPMNGIDHENHVKIRLYNLIILEAVIFFEEFNGYKENIELQFHKKMKDVAKITGPIRRKINLQHLQNFRNNFIAHPWRDKKGNFVKPDDPIYKVPRNLLEVNLLAFYIEYIIEVIRAEFKQEFADSVYHMLKQIPPEFPSRDYTTLNEEQLQMAREVNQIAIDLEKPYRLNVMLFEFPEDVELKSKPRPKKTNHPEA